VLAAVVWARHVWGIPHDTREVGIGEDERGFTHSALFYQGPWEYLAGTVPFLLEGLAAHIPVAVAAPGPRLRSLRDALGANAERVQLLDMTVAGRNPGRIIPEVLLAVADAHPNRHVRIIGEPIWPGRSQIEYPACAQHEALINLAFRGRGASIRCPYDVAGLEPAVVADAAATHPMLIQSGRSWRSPDYAPQRILSAYNLPLPDPPDAVVFPFDARRLCLARRSAADHARHAGLDEERIEDVQLVVGELAANSLRHGGGSGVLRTWIDAQYWVCQVRDGGWISDPLAGRRRASDTDLHGRGLLMVNNLADLVRVHTRPGETTIRAYFRL
jgi:anti-sigma regulatory factor (Ser/Thr protein kinase)